MEDLSVKAIVIGVSTFVTMAVLTAIILYFNTAKQLADSVNKRTDIASSYDNIMNSDNFTDELTGVEVRSLINKYAGVSNVNINIATISGETVNEYENINNMYIYEKGWLNKLNNNASIISEEKLDLINPVWKCVVNKVENKGTIILEIELDVD